MKKNLRPRNIQRLLLNSARQSKKAWLRVKGFHCFTKELLRNPRSIGAICPSGKQLSRLMASLIPDSKGLIVEIGAGTGAITKAILKRGVDSDRLLVIERSPELCKTLRIRFPGLNVVEGDATMLSNYLPPETPVAAVVSSVPLVNLAVEVRNAILAQIHSIVKDYGCVIQYTYAVWGTSPYCKAGFFREKYHLVPWNVPPAKVECFRV